MSTRMPGDHMVLTGSGQARRLTAEQLAVVDFEVLDRIPCSDCYQCWGRKSDVDEHRENTLQLQVGLRAGTEPGVTVKA